MKISIRECPLCKSQMAARHPPPGSMDMTVRYICGTHVPGTKLSHYYVEAQGNYWAQVVHLPPYVIVNRSNKETSEVYPYEGVGTGHITDRKLIMEIPRLELTTTEKLTERLKILVLFS